MALLPGAIFVWGLPVGAVDRAQEVQLGVCYRHGDVDLIKEAAALNGWHDFRVEGVVESGVRTRGPGAVLVLFADRTDAADLEHAAERLQCVLDELERDGVSAVIDVMDAEEERLRNAAPELRDELARVVDRLGNMEEDGHIASIENGWLYDNHGNRVESIESFLRQPRAALKNVGVDA